MSVPANTTSDRKSFWSLRRAIAAMTGLVIACAIALVAGLAIVQSSEIIRGQFEKTSGSITALLGANLGGAVKFGKVDILEAQFQTFIEEKQGDVDAIGVYKPDGTEIAKTAAGTQAMSALALRAAEAGEIVVGPEGKLRAVPVWFGRNNDIVGALVIAWNDAQLVSAIDQISFFLGGIGLLVAIVCSAGAALVLGPLLSSPLRRLTDAVGRLAEGSEEQIKEARRGDEIGGLARALGKVHEQGLRAKRIRSAVDGSSIMVMVCDEGLGVVYISGALESYIASNSATLASRAGRFTAGDPSSLS
ncbi:MAG: HAMP domain-containing protein, partial [Pseudomonadota bacterium]